MNQKPPPPEPPMSRREALLKLGFFQAIDAVYMVVIFGLFATAGARALFFAAPQVEVLVWMIVALGISQIWTITLCYRLSWFVLSAQADINLLPEAAARIVIGYQQKNP